MKKNKEGSVSSTFYRRSGSSGSVFSLSLLTVSILAGCGGGDGDGDGDNAAPTTSVPAVPAPSSAAYYDVTAIDGYLQNARVFLDTNHNGQLDAGEPNGLTLNQGRVSLDVTEVSNPEDYHVYVQAERGVTLDEQSGTFVKRDFVLAATPGSEHVTPLTTLAWVRTLQGLGLAQSQPATEEEREVLQTRLEQVVTQIATELGISPEAVGSDFVAQGDTKALFAAESLVASGVLPAMHEELQALLNIGHEDTQAYETQYEVVSQMIAGSLQVTDVEAASLPPLFEAPELDVNGFLECDSGYKPLSGVCVVDTDGDGIVDYDDTDDDNDGVPDVRDAFPLDETDSLDSDGDFIGDMHDNDDDNDGVLDGDDMFPLNPEESVDRDEDGVGDNTDVFPYNRNEQFDTDGDGMGNHADLDDDNDGVEDFSDRFPLDVSEWDDRDGDGVGDNADAFDADPNESVDRDKDGVGDNSDAFPQNPLESVDSDGDGAGDNADQFPNDPNERFDFDGDGVGDNSDAFPDDPKDSADTDGDGIGNSIDDDIDGDGYLNVNDRFPEDASEWIDRDEDGVGDNADAFDDDPTETLDSDKDGVGDNSDALPDDSYESIDTDKDGVGNNKDLFPNNSNEWADTDGDGTGDNSDDDIDGDSVPNVDDKFPSDPTESADSDNDGVGDNTDVFDDDPNESSDRDGDGVGDNSDKFPDDIERSKDTDGDGISDKDDPDIDGDYVRNEDDDFPSDPTESKDSDRDGAGDNIDVFPNDPAESKDTDGDGTGDVADENDDNDSFNDDVDAFPEDDSEWSDLDSDGIGDNRDADDDGDGYGDVVDAFPLDSTEWLDTDGDGSGNNVDTDDDDDGYLDEVDGWALDATRQLGAFELTEVAPQRLAWTASIEHSNVVYTACREDEAQTNNCQVLATIEGQTTEYVADVIDISQGGLLQYLDARFFVIAGLQGSVDTQQTEAVTFTDLQSLNGSIQHLKASNAEAVDEFGYSVALSGDGRTLVVGAIYEDSDASGINGDGSRQHLSDSGAAYVFRFANDTWVEEAYVKASNPTSTDHFGFSVALSEDGNTLAVGSVNEDSNARGIDGDGSNGGVADSGAAYVFRFANDTWAEEAYIKSSNSAADDSFGRAVSLADDGSTLAVGAHAKNNSSGAAYVFRFATDTWVEEAYIPSSTSSNNDYFGRILALSADGNTLAVGAIGESNGGAAYVYRHTNNLWWEEAMINASNQHHGDYFGQSVALSADGNTLAVGAHQEDSSARGINGDQNNDDNGNSGAAYLFRFNEDEGEWTQKAYTKPTNPDGDELEGGFYGVSVGLSEDGKTLAVGANLEGGANNQSGAVYVY
ncbi:thrombospondin type 3 repeat-containing protein [Vibrio sp. 10N.261.55.A7]|uniref:thrombospondin type 3 repeat-containing protein n=1 Tax=Vibrio sp. 10N.261.55.A7 TaxID=1880851 RepID=UPI000C82F05C|nr:thrombospondin type 3 repeat-containing protein [Vibrio sp. 10N.261.55.A7]PMJ91317.1 hypothetical protein BCU12_10380 [Vibrio sp. 10N.261.55.A7]